MWILFACAEADKEAASNPGPAAKNLLLISIDTLRADHLGFMGFDRDTSPRLDEFAATACVFRQAQSTSSWTLPAVASLVTSLLPTTHGVQDYRGALDDSFVALGELLRDAGFQTGGVTSHMFVSPRFGITQGIEDFDDSLVAGGKQAHLQISSPGVTERGIRWLKQREGDSSRWFLWLHYFDPHHEYQRHPGITERFGDRDVDRYDGEIAFTDHHVGRVLDALSECGFADETVVFLVSDHGEEFRERKKLRHGFTLYQEVARVPYAIRSPGFPPRVIDDPVGIVDALPTVLELLGVPAPPAIEGVSLVPLMRGVARAQPLPQIAELRLHDGYHSDSVRLGKWKLIVDHSNTSAVGYAEVEGGPPVDASEKPIPPRVEPGPRVFLFDLESDPGETRDLSAAREDAKNSLAALLESRLTRARKLRESGRYRTESALELSAEERLAIEQLGY